MDKKITKKSIYTKFILGLFFSLSPFMFGFVVKKVGLYCNYASSNIDAICLKWWFIWLGLATWALMFIGIIFLIWAFSEERKRNKQNQNV